MKPVNAFVLGALIAAAMAGCGRNGVVDEHQGRSADGNGGTGGADAVTLKEGHGLALHPKLRENIDLRVEEVGEHPVAPIVTAQLLVVRGADTIRPVALAGDDVVEARGWIAAALAAHVKAGQEVELRTGKAVEKGIVKQVEKPPFAALGEFEVVVETAHGSTAAHGSMLRSAPRWASRSRRCLTPHC